MVAWIQAQYLLKIGTSLRRIALTGARGTQQAFHQLCPGSLNLRSHLVGAAQFFQATGKLAFIQAPATFANQSLCLLGKFLMLSDVGLNLGEFTIIWKFL